MTDHASAESPRNDANLELQSLEREKLRVEIEQLRSAARIRWITPAALATLLPLVAGLGLWTIGELKQYNEGYRALAERDELQKEKDDLQRQKDSLNLEVATLLQLKTHYAAEAERLRLDTEAKQAMIDQTYLRGVFHWSEAMYALDHLKGMGPPPNLDDLRSAIEPLPQRESEKLNEMLAQYELAHTIIDITRNIVTEFDGALKLMPSSDWTRDLVAMPSGSVIQNRKIMTSRMGTQQRYYDVSAGRFLTEEEVASATRP